MRTQSYIKYLETIILALLEERGDKGEIEINQEDAFLPLRGKTATPYNVKESIRKAYEDEKGAWNEFSDMERAWVYGGSKRS